MALIDGQESQVFSGPWKSRAAVCTQFSAVTSPCPILSQQPALRNVPWHTWSTATTQADPGHIKFNRQTSSMNLPSECGGIYRESQSSKQERCMARNGLHLVLMGLSLAAGLFSRSAATTLKPTKSFEAWFEVEQAPRVPFEAVQTVVDFPPGASVARHTHGGPAHVMVTENTIKLLIDGQPERSIHAGESVVEPYLAISSAKNYGTEQVSLIATYLIPVGAQLTVFEPTAPSAAPTSSPPPPGSISRFQSRMRLYSAPEHYSVHQFLLTFEPGGPTTPEVVRAPRLLTVVSGEVTLLSSSRKTYKAGEYWIETPGRASLISENVGEEKAIVVVSVVPA